MENKINAEEVALAKAEELAATFNETYSKSVEKLNESIEAKASKDEIATLKVELEEMRLEQSKALNTILKDTALSIKKLSEKEVKDLESTPTVFENLTKNADKIKGLRESGGKINFKAVGTMTIAGNVSGGNVPVEQRIAGMNAIASRRIRIFDIVSRGVASSDVISWVYQSGKEGAAGQTAEGVLKNQIDYDLVVASESVKKTTAFIKISDEMLDDVDFMNSEINNELSRELLKAVEAQIYEGDGTGTNLNGIKTTATAFAAGAFALAVDNANIVDVLRVAMNQILIADQDPATFILMHPSDVTALKLVKVGSADNRYVDELQIIAGQLTLDGVPIIATTLVTVDEYLVGNFSLATIYDKGSVNIEMGLDANDFTLNLMTVRAEWRGLVVVKNNDRTAFVTGDFTTDKAALETA